MKLSRIEFLAMNNPIRRFVQKHLEFRKFKRYLKDRDIDLIGKIILDAGCGSGYSTELIFNEFAPSQLVAFDLMPEQINLANKRNLGADFFVGDVANIELPSNMFDAVFIFGILHHVPDWKRALREMARVLKPQGVLLMEEVGGTIIELVKWLGFVHPKEAMFSWPEFENEVRLAGFEIIENKKIVFEGFKSFLCLKRVPERTGHSRASSTEKKP